MRSNPSDFFPKPAVLVLSTFGILPWFSYKTNKLLYKRLYKIYTVLLFSAVISLYVTLNYLRSQNIPSQSSKTVMVTGIFNAISGLVIIAQAVMGSAFWNMKTWEILFRKMRSTRRLLTPKSPSTNWRFLLGNFCFTALLLADGIDSNNQLFIYFSELLVIRYFYFIISYTISNVTYSIWLRYKRIRKSFRAPFGEDVIEKFHCVEQDFKDMYSVTQCFNSLFGWTLLLLFFSCLTQMLSFCIFVVTDRVTWSNKQFQISKIVIVVNIGYFLIAVVWLTAIIFCCDSVVREADELLTNCYRLEQTLPLLSKELEELESLKQLIKNKSPKLTAAGFFEIRRSTLLSLLSTTTTYFIVALQFNSL